METVHSRMIVHVHFLNTLKGMKRLDQSKWENAYFGGKVKFSNWADKNHQSGGFSEYACLGTDGKWYSKDDCDVICIESKREIQPISVCHVNDCASTATCRSDSTSTYGYKCVCNNIVLANTITLTPSGDGFGKDGCHWSISDLASPSGQLQLDTENSEQLYVSEPQDDAQGEGESLIDGQPGGQGQISEILEFLQNFISTQPENSFIEPLYLEDDLILFHFGRFSF